MKKAGWVLLSALALSACVAHEKQGDSAAAVGDWKTAYFEYQIALREKPETPGLKEKFDNARKEVAVLAWNRAQGCEAQQEWQCALDESTFIVQQLDPNHPGAISLKTKAGLQVALKGVNEARALGRSNRYEEAFAQLQRARQTSTDPAVQSEANNAQAEIVVGGAQQAEMHRRSKEFEKAAKLYELIAGVDGKYATQAREVAAERDAYLGQLYEEQAKQGDLAMKNNNFRAAHPFYKEAENIKRNGRAEPLLRYTTELIAADDAINARNFPAAERSLRAAIATSQDRGMAADMLERVRMKPYRVAVKSVLVNPMRTDGNPWVGTATALFFRVANQVATAAAKLDHDHAANLAQLMPTENLPKVRVEVVMPNGQVLTTGARDGVYTLHEGEFVIAGNGFDSRRLTFVVRTEKNNEEIGRIDASYADLFSKKNLYLSSQTIAHLRIAADSAEGRREGDVVGLTVVQPATMNADGTPIAPPAGTGTTAPAAGTGAGTTAPASTSTTGTVAPAGGTTAPVVAPPPKTKTR